MRIWAARFHHRGADEANFTTEAQRTQRLFFSFPLPGDSGKGKTTSRCAANVSRNLVQIRYLNDVSIRNIINRKIKKMPEGLSFFTQSSSPDWVKEKSFSVFSAPLW